MGVKNAIGFHAYGVRVMILLIGQKQQKRDTLMENGIPAL